MAARPPVALTRLSSLTQPHGALWPHFTQEFRLLRPPYAVQLFEQCWVHEVEAVERQSLPRALRRCRVGQRLAVPASPLRLDEHKTTDDKRAAGLARFGDGLGDGVGRAQPAWLAGAVHGPGREDEDAASLGRRCGGCRAWTVRRR